MVRLGRRKAPPAGWEEIEPVIRELELKMREEEAKSHEGKRVVESGWGVLRLHHQRSRYIYELYYEQKAISRELYEWCVGRDGGIADRDLIAKWRRPGYERLCCLRCIQPQDSNFGTTCICRVPRAQLPEADIQIGENSRPKVIECVNCGCRGCGGH